MNNWGNLNTAWTLDDFTGSLLIFLGWKTELCLSAFLEIHAEVFGGEVSLSTISLQMLHLFMYRACL